MEKEEKFSVRNVHITISGTADDFPRNENPQRRVLKFELKIRCTPDIEANP